MLCADARVSSSSVNNILGRILTPSNISTWAKSKRLDPMTQDYKRGWDDPAVTECYLWSKAYELQHKQNDLPNAANRATDYHAGSNLLGKATTCYCGLPLVREYQGPVHLVSVANLDAVCSSKVVWSVVFLISFSNRWRTVCHDWKAITVPATTTARMVRSFSNGCVVRQAALGFQGLVSRRHLMCGDLRKHSIWFLSKCTLLVTRRNLFEFAVS